MNIRAKILIIVAMLALSPRGQAAPFHIGDSQESVIESLGPPIREEQSISGTLLVYRSSLIYLVDGKVDFISLGPTQLLSDKHARVVTEAAPSSAVSAAPTASDSDGPHHAFENHPVFANAVQRQQDDMRVSTRHKASLDAYWATLRRDFAQNSRFDAPGGMRILKSSDGQIIPAVGETRRPAWHYLDVGVDEVLLTDQGIE